MISERCSCGAKIHIQYLYPDEERIVLAWRKNHIHEMPEPEILAPPQGAESSTQIHPGEMFFEQRSYPIGFQA